MLFQASCHSEVNRALQKNGWVISSEQIRFDSDILAVVDMEVMKDGETAYILIKCFSDPNITQEIFGAVGQYLVYRTLLNKVKSEAVLYLSVPENIYQKHFTDPIRRALQSNGIKMIIVDLAKEEIVQWIQ